MGLQRGIAIRLAPRFQSALAWRDRIRVNGGVEAHAGHVCSRRDWRAPSSAELEMLVAGADAAPLEAEVALLNIPADLRQAWWTVAGGTAAPPGGGEPYRAFVDRVLEFLRFKRVPLPRRCRVDVQVSRPGQPSTRWDSTRGAGGLGFSAEADDGTFGHLVGLVNLDDEPTHVVLVNLTPAAMAASVGATPATPGPGLLARFFANRSTYPLVRVRLDAGDGLWLPACGIAYDVSTLDKREIDVVLTIRAALDGAG